MLRRLRGGAIAKCLVWSDELSDPASPAPPGAAFKPVDAKSFANLLLDWAEQATISVSPMKLQKLLYYCHADFLIVTGSPLLQQEFEAWEYGPVIPSLFHEFKAHGSEPINSRAFRFDPVSCRREQAPPCKLGPYESVIRASFGIYAKHSASALSNMSHSESGPWAETLRRFTNGSPRGRSIENRVIFEYHRRQVAQSVH